ncbi:hypothetical protein DFH06DRAFT_970105 [Mycena polygramma]|nr:hypothetical protein DFH06DRAFT_970105 [Mycena polygramma]
MHHAAKRAKTAQACASCRKNKTRCEILDHSSSPVRCHRCKVLSIECSYEHTRVQTPAHLVSRPPVPALFEANASGDQPHTATMKPRLWSFISQSHTIDWSAPMLAIQHLPTSPSVNTASPQFVDRDLSLSVILPGSRIDSLIDTFDTQYTPWLNFQPIRNSTNPLIDIACCAVAARHLEGENEVRLRLQALARQSVAQIMSDPAASGSIETVQSLLILSLWVPFGAAPETEGWDPRSMISTAVHLAVNLGLNEASAVANEMRKRQFNPVAAQMVQVSERARLWIALTNAESLVCLGTRRAPSSSRTAEDNLLVQFPRSLNARSDFRDLRLGLIARQFDLFEECTAVCLGSDKTEWAQDMKSVLEAMRREKRLLLPLSVVLDTDQFYFHALHISHGGCRLLALYHAFWEARSSLPQIPIGQPWHNEFMPFGAGEKVLSAWGRDMLQTCEALLVAFLSLPPTRLCTAPDTYFHIVALAAAYLVGVKFLVLRLGPNSMLLGASDLLLAKTITNLRGAACGPGHAAHRCAFLVQSMLDKWNARGSTGSRISQPLPQQTASAIPPADSSRQIHGNGVIEALPCMFSGFDVEFMFLNSMLADAKQFWDALAQEQLTW